MQMKNQDNPYTYSYIIPLLNNTQQSDIIQSEGGDEMAKPRRVRPDVDWRKHNQKMKPFLVYQYLMQETDKDHYVTTDDIIDYLEENFEIYTERRSIYNDIQEINKALLALQEDITLEEAEQLLEEDESNKFVVHHKRKGFHIPQRKYEEDDIRLLAECVYTAKFVDDNRANKLADIVFQSVSTHQANQMSHNAIVQNRAKTSNTKVFYTVHQIHEAIGKGGRDTQKIKFKYFKHVPQNINQQVEMRKGKDYVVVPYSLIIDNGNYYLLGYDEAKQDMRTFRVDRMVIKKPTNDYNTNDKLFDGIELDRYTKEHFGMFGGRAERVTLNCSNQLLDTMIDRFGIDGMNYIPVEKSHFDIRVTVYISNQFFGWLSGFGKMIQITSPLSVREEYAAYLNKITEWHSKPLDDKK